MYTFVFGDIHGKPEALRRLLQAAGVLTDSGERRPETDFPEGYLKPFNIYSIGDIANAVQEDVNGDEACLLMAQRLGIKLIMGNHESGYLFDDMGFNGYSPQPHLKSLYRSMMFQGQVVPAALVGNTLLTHAGVVEQLGWVTAQEAFRAIMSIWEDYSRLTISDVIEFPRYDVPKELVLGGVSRMRGGTSPFGGILWADWREPKNFHFSQVMGHTPMPEGPVHTVYKTNETFTLNIDAGGKSGYDPWGVWLNKAGEIVSFVKAPSEEE